MTSTLKNKVIIKDIITFVIYLIALNINTIFIVSDNLVFNFLTSSGIALGIILTFGKRYFYSLYFANFVFYFFTLDFIDNIYFKIFFIFILTSINIIQIYAVYNLLNRFNLDKNNLFNSPRNSMKYLITVVLTSLLFSILKIIIIDFKLQYTSLQSIYFIFGFSIFDINSILLLSPLILSLSKNKTFYDKGKFTEHIVMHIYILFFCSFLLILKHNPTINFAAAIIIIALILWPSMRFDLYNSSIIVFLIYLIATLFTRLELGIFYTGDIDQSIITLKLFMIEISTLSILISATVNERKKDLADMESLNENLESIVYKRTLELNNKNRELIDEIKNRKKTEKILNQTKNYLDNMNTRLFEIKELAHLGYWEIDLETQIIYFESQTAIILGLSHMDVSIDIKDYLDILDDEHKDVFLNSLDKMQKNRVAQKILLKHILKNNTINFSILKGKYIKENNNPPKLIGYLVDKTDEIMAQNKLEYYATTDEMTGLLNRRTGILLLEKNFERAKRNQIELSIAYIDANNLKYINDNYGHNEGDYLIKTISNVILESIRDTDFATRLGGDEMLITFVDCNFTNSQIIIKRIEDRLKQINKENKKPFDIIISYGISSYLDNKIPNIDDFIVDADNKMYLDKKNKKELAKKNNL